jgi:hypothetical protein
MAAFTLMCSVRIVSCRPWARRAASPATAAGRLAALDLARQHRRGVAASLWGLAGWLFYNQGTALEQTGLIVIVYTYCAVDIPVLSIQRRLPGVRGAGVPAAAGAHRDGRDPSITCSRERC